MLKKKLIRSIYVFLLKICICFFSLEELEVHLGAVLIYDESEPGRVILTASGVLVHPDFNFETKQNDIALIALPVPASGQSR
jgi:hypothetical protein